MEKHQQVWKGKDLSLEWSRRHTLKKRTDLHSRTETENKTAKRNVRETVRNSMQTEVHKGKSQKPHKLVGPKMMSSVRFSFEITFILNKIVKFSGGLQ